MADTPKVELESGASIDYADHEAMYDLFINIVKYSTAAVAIVLILLAYFLI